ncbi:hypothetical protein AMAG_02212 [Allomyces macrogynus ATCC 38327]|uniref:Myb-like domain-containing protein n=1 Tax=Allomyces macrogynus (strain ATCC 38327) TaxID=578462 RepID=A0A0L0S1I8_ALLM3|nr:hypothetical protein AMAG_02212 [Allomyces macrogynus ATCC 38327]|eukprot:KNE56403.1 hypothetical protein AMAG_02212 [Allomyces macrogynus ATCC 38327]
MTVTPATPAHGQVDRKRPAPDATPELEATPSPPGGSRPATGEAAHVATPSAAGTGANGQKRRKIDGEPADRMNDATPTNVQRLYPALDDSNGGSPMPTGYSLAEIMLVPPTAAVRTPAAAAQPHLIPSSVTSVTPSPAGLLQATPSRHATTVETDDEDINMDQWTRNPDDDEGFYAGSLTADQVGHLDTRCTQFLRAVERAIVDWELSLKVDLDAMKDALETGGLFRDKFTTNVETRPVAIKSRPALSEQPTVPSLLERTQLANILAFFMPQQVTCTELELFYVLEALVRDVNPAGYVWMVTENLRTFIGLLGKLVIKAGLDLNSVQDLFQASRYGDLVPYLDDANDRLQVFNLGDRRFRVQDEVRNLALRVLRSLIPLALENKLTSTLPEEPTIATARNAAAAAAAAAAHAHAAAVAAIPGSEQYHQHLAHLHLLQMHAHAHAQAQAHVHVHPHAHAHVPPPPAPPGTAVTMAPLPPFFSAQDILAAGDAASRVLATHVHGAVPPPIVPPPPPPTTSSSTAVPSTPPVRRAMAAHIEIPPGQGEHVAFDSPGDDVAQWARVPMDGVDPDPDYVPVLDHGGAVPPPPVPATPKAKRERGSRKRDLGARPTRSRRVGQTEPEPPAPQADDGAHAHENGDAAAAPAAPARTPQRRGPRIQWTPEEVAALEHAMSEHGTAWALILQKYGANGEINQSLARFDQMKLKDKARNVRTSRERNGEPLGPFVLATRYPAQSHASTANVAQAAQQPEQQQQVQETAAVPEQPALAE